MATIKKDKATSVKAVIISKPQEKKLSTEQTVQKVISGEVAKFDKFETRLNELKEKYKDLTIVDVNDKEGYENVRVAIGDLRSIRTGTDADKKVIKAPFLAACSTIEERSKWIIAEVSKIETPLQKRKDEIDEEKEKIKADKKAKQEAAFAKRLVQLTAMGASFADGMNLVLEDVSYEAVLIRESDDEIYEQVILPKYKSIFDKNEAERIKKQQEEEEKKRKQEEEQEKLKKQQQELQEAQERLKRDQEELQRQKDEAARKELAERTNNRVKQIAAIGLQFDGISEYRYKGAFITLEDVKTFQDDTWNQLINTAEKVVSEIKEKEEREKKEQNERKAIMDARKAKGETRLSLLEAVGCEGDAMVLGSLSDNEWEELYRDATRAYDDLKKKKWLEDQQKQQQEEEQKRKDELAQADDKTKWTNLLSQINSISIPEFKTTKYKNAGNSVLEYINHIKKLNP